MSLTQALSSALSGLQVNQAGIALVAANVANADTPGYTRKVMDQVATGTSTSIGVRVGEITKLTLQGNLAHIDMVLLD